MADDHWLRDPADGPLLENEPVARRAGAVAILAVALFAAFVIPDAPIGSGIPIVALMAAVAVILAHPGIVDAWGLVLGALGIGLTAMAAVRDAEWVVAVDLLGAGGLATVIVARSVRWREVVAAPLRVLGGVAGSVPFVLRPMRGAVRLGRLAPVLRGAILASSLVVVFGMLFASADRAFARIASEVLLPDWDLSLLPARVVVFGLVALGAAALARTAAGFRERVTEDGPRRGIGRTEWTIALGTLDLLFALFVVVQITVLFGGRAHVLETAGLTYAEYARQGFFQLLAVGILTLAVVAGAVRWARREGRADTVRLQVLVGLLGLFAIVVLASAFRRLSLYESVFGYTRLRLSVHATILWMAGLFILVMIAGIRMRAAWLPRATLILTAGALLAFTLADPDGLIAERNVQRFKATGELDLYYARSLSADAAPALLGLPPRLGCLALEPIAAHVGSDDPAFGWNLSRARARDLLGDRVSDSAPQCSPFMGLPGVRWWGGVNG